MRKIDISIIIVNYKSKNELFNCIKSIKKSRTNFFYEIIVVDNDEKELIKRELLAQFKYVRYIKAKKNLGYGAGNNFGAKYAKGDYLFFLNPDTLVFKNTIENLVRFIKKNDNIAGVSPLMLHKNKKVFFYQGTRKLGILEGIFSLSFIDKIFPNNLISKKYYYLNWNKKKNKEVDVLPGSAMFIRRSIFEKVKGFDESFFLYFEENDLCIRIKKLGHKLYIISNAKFIHHHEVSTSQKKDKDKVFNQSRFLYFKKYHGLFWAKIINFWLNLKKRDLLLLGVLVIGAFLRFYKLNELMIFIGDQGWFYLSARDMLINSNIPLVGIPSSVVWLKQGPLATYFIALAFLIGNFNPISPAILFSIFDIITIYLIFLIGKRFLNKTAGLFSAFFYATSPLIVLMTRMPYHTSMVPFFACIFFLILSSLNKKTKNYFFLFLILGFLIQLELSNFVIFAIVILYFYLKKIKINLKVFYVSALGFIIGTLPFIINDLSNKFIQTLGLPVWIINRIRLFLGLTLSGNSTTANFPNALLTAETQLVEVIFPHSKIIFYLILIISLIGFLFFIKRNIKKEAKTVLLWFFIPLFGFLIHAGPGSAYFPLIFPAIALLIGFGANYFYNINKYLVITIFLIVVACNTIFLLLNNYYISTNNLKITMPPYNYSYGPTWTVYDDVAKKIVDDSFGLSFQVNGAKSLGKYTSGIDNFKYLIWLRGGNYSSIANNIYFIYYNNEVSLKEKGLPLYRNNYFSIYKNENK